MSTYSVDTIKESNPNKDIGLTIENTLLQDNIIETEQTSSKNMTIGASYNALIPNEYIVNSVLTIEGLAVVID